MDGRIALEEHITTERNNHIWDAKGEDSRKGWAYARDVKARLLSPNLHLLEMDRAAIEHIILSLTSPGVQSVVNRDEVMDLTRQTDGQKASIICKHPGRFSSIAVIKLQDSWAATAELERAVRSLELTGALINDFTNMSDGDDIQYLDEAPAWEF